jgi:SagB-type dehydrogenase family enzyme
MSLITPNASSTSSPVAPHDALSVVLRYHEQTKHHFNRYARSLGALDWANQPDPFRRYAGAPLVPLLLFGPDEPPPPSSASPQTASCYDDLYQSGAIPAQPVTVATLSRFLELSLALSAWKRAGNMTWALRINPSSGNLHPTEGYLFVGADTGSGPGFDLDAGVYHYAPREHGLERRLRCEPTAATALLAAFPAGAFLVGLTSIHWREAWKYGERAFRYCQHDVGHAVGAVRMAAATLGWRGVVLEGIADDTLASLLGTDREQDYARAEREHPDCLLVIWPEVVSAPEPAAVQKVALSGLSTEALEMVIQGQWTGQANRLSQEDPVPWEMIHDVAMATWKQEAGVAPVLSSSEGESRSEPPGPRAEGPLASQIIRQRRSAVAFDGMTTLSVERFYLMLQRLLPCMDRALHDRPAPWDAWPWVPSIHLGLFVHRVIGLEPGLYFLLRDPAQRDRLQGITQTAHERFVWQRPPGCPESLPLFLLEAGDARKVAIQVSCHQDIAGDSAFSLGMIAEFESRLREQGAWFYRRLFWESGLIGQVLYLEAEAAGVRGTGIGCFFDDPVHQLFGLPDQEFQSLYHFTVGGPVEDRRLMTLPPYGQDRVQSSKESVT